MDSVVLETHKWLTDNPLRVSGDPLNPNIKIRILICYPYPLPIEVVGGNCLSINQVHLVPSSFLFSATGAH